MTKLTHGPRLGGPDADILQRMSQSVPDGMDGVRDALAADPRLTEAQIAEIWTFYLKVRAAAGSRRPSVQRPSVTPERHGGTAGAPDGPGGSTPSGGQSRPRS
jgi:hypothetical protein